MTIREQIMALEVNLLYPVEMPKSTANSIREALCRLMAKAADLAEAREKELLAEIDKWKTKVLETQGMADCMAMVHEELQNHGVVDKNVPPMFIPEAVLTHIHIIKSKRAQMIAELRSKVKPNASYLVLDLLELANFINKFEVEK